MIQFISPSRLRHLGILGMNRRNIGIIGAHNRRKDYPIADNKLKTKGAALSRGIPVPELYGTIEHQFQIKMISERLKMRDSFVIKPAQGSGGRGILVVTKRNDDLFVKAGGLQIDSREVQRHVSNILAGLYSLGGRNDSAMIEALIDFDPVLAGYSVDGVPDIRVIVFRGVPVMAMIRCATTLSDGKANLHQGAVRLLDFLAAVEADGLGQLLGVDVVAVADEALLALPGLDVLRKLRVGERVRRVGCARHIEQAL